MVLANALTNKFYRIYIMVLSNCVTQRLSEYAYKKYYWSMASLKSLF